MTKFIHTDHVIFCLDLGLLPRSIICNRVVFQQPPGHGYLDVPPSSGNASPKLAHLLLLKAIFPCPFLLVSPWLEILESALTFPFLIPYTQCVTRPFLSDNFFLPNVAHSNHLLSTAPHLSPLGNAGLLNFLAGLPISTLSFLEYTTQITSPQILFPCILSVTFSKTNNSSILTLELSCNLAAQLDFQCLL